MRTYPIYKAKAKHDITLAHNGNNPYMMKILKGDIGTFQMVTNSMDESKPMIEARFKRPIINSNGEFGMIRFFPKGKLPSNGDIREHLTLKGDVEILLNPINAGSSKFCGDLDLTNSNLLGEEFSYAGGLKNIGKNIGKNIKKTGAKIKKKGSNIKKGVISKAKKVKKVAKKIKDKVGAVGAKFRNKFRGLLRKGVLLNIKNNIHGTATKLYPAVASDSDVKSRKYKASFVAKSKKVYAQLVAKWKSMGGKEDELKTAIVSGSKKRFLKMPYKSATGNNSVEFYDYFTPDVYSYHTDLNKTFSAEGDEEVVEEEIPTQEEQTKGLKGFFAWLKGLFNKNGANENPYEEGTLEAGDYSADLTADAGNEPSESEANNEVMSELDKSADSDSLERTEEDEASDDDDKILGINKTLFWVGVGVLGLIGGYFIYKGVKGGGTKVTK